MIVVKDEMRIVETKYLAPACKQTKVLLDDKSYKRLCFLYKDKTISIQWMEKGNFVSSSKEKILEKIFSEIESN